MADLIKIVYEYSDKSKKYIESVDLDKWLAFNAMVAQHAANHNLNPPWEEINWKKISGKSTEY